MQRVDIKSEYERIGRERDEGIRQSDREKLWLALRTLGWCWLWVLAGLIGMSFNVNATIGPLYFPGKMLVARSYFWGGVLVGAGGAFTTLVIAWRKAMERGMLE
jgi:hypothetical protein